MKHLLESLMRFVIFYKLRVFQQASYLWLGGLFAILADLLIGKLLADLCANISAGILTMNLLIMLAEIFYGISVPVGCKICMRTAHLNLVVGFKSICRVLFDHSLTS